MKKVIIISTFAVSVLVLVALFFLSKKETITGKVLIVQANAVVHRMALIQVYAIEKSEAEKWRRSIARDALYLMNQISQEEADSSQEVISIKSSYEAKIKKLDDSLMKAEEAAQLAKRVWIVDRLDETSKRNFFLLATGDNFPRAVEVGNLALNSDWQQAQQLLSNQIIPDLKNELNEMKARKDARVSSVELKSREKVLELSAQLRRLLDEDNLNNIPPYIQIAARDTTDESGEFKLKVASGDYYIVANGARRVFADTEYYHWAYPVHTSSQDSEKLLLGNNNQIDVKGADNLWRALFEDIKMFKAQK